MPVYNGAKYLKAAVESVLSQTYRQFDLLIIDDGSTDSSMEVIGRFTDDRIRVITNRKNTGLIATLNKGLGLIQSPYIVRMDQDDICVPRRLEMQVRYMDANPAIAASGGGIRIWDSIRRRSRISILPSDPRKIRTYLLFMNILHHPTMILRNSVIQKERYRYNPDHISLEDFGLWQKMSFKYPLGNIARVILKYRILESGMTQVAEKNVPERDAAQMKILRQSVKFLKIRHTDSDIRRLRYFLTGRIDLRGNQIPALAVFLKSIMAKLDNDTYDTAVAGHVFSSAFRKCGLGSRLKVGQLHAAYNRYFRPFFRFDAGLIMKYVIRSMQSLSKV